MEVKHSARADEQIHVACANVLHYCNFCALFTMRFLSEKIPISVMITCFTFDLQWRLYTSKNKLCVGEANIIFLTAPRVIGNFEDKVMVKEHTIFFVKYLGLCSRKLSCDILAVKACEMLKKHETHIGTPEDRL